MSADDIGNILEIPTKEGRHCVMVFTLKGKTFVGVGLTDENATLKVIQDETRVLSKGEMIVKEVIFIPKED